MITATYHSIWLTVQQLLSDVRVHVLPPLLLVLGGWDLDALPHTGQVDAAACHHSGTVLQAECGQQQAAHTQTYMLTHTRTHRRGRTTLMTEYTHYLRSPKV